MLQRKALRECKKLERKIIRMKGERPVPRHKLPQGERPFQGIHDRALYVRGLVQRTKARAAAMKTDAGRYGQGRR